MGNCGCLGKKLIKTNFVKTKGSNDSEVNKVFSINSEIDQINNEDINFTNNSEKRKTKHYQTKKTEKTAHSSEKYQKSQTKFTTNSLIKNKSSFDINFKKSTSLKGKNEIDIVLIGEKQTGKSAFIIKLVENKFENLYIPTVFVERYSKELTYNFKKYTLNFEVTPGVEEYKEDYSYLYSHANFILFFYDITQSNCIERVKNYVKKELKNQLFLYSNNNSNIFIIGNKIDIYPDINNDDIKNYCNDHLIHFFEISVKTGIGIYSLINKILELFYEISS